MSIASDLRDMAEELEAELEVVERLRQLAGNVVKRYRAGGTHLADGIEELEEFLAAIDSGEWREEG